jgi:hypothetical protein
MQLDAKQGLASLLSLAILRATTPETLMVPCFGILIN